MVEGSCVPVAKIKKINGVAWLKRADGNDGDYGGWLHVHEHGVQTYYPITEDGEIDLDFRPRPSELEDEQSKFTSDSGARLTHMLLLKAGTCRVSGQRISAGSIVLRDDLSDWNMSLEEAESRGLSEELTRTSPDGAPMTPVRPSRSTKCSAPGCRRTISSPASHGDGCLAGCDASPPPKATHVVFVPLRDGQPDEASDFTLCAPCMERSPEFNDVGAHFARKWAKSTAAARGAHASHVQARGLDMELESAPPGAEVYIYVPKDCQHPRGSGWEPDTPRSVTTPRAVKGHDHGGFSRYERFHVVDKKMTKGQEWLKLASGGWVQTCQKSHGDSVRIVFPLDEAINNDWIPADERE